jgi:hypothetical protein
MIRLQRHLFVGLLLAGGGLLVCFGEPFDGPDSYQGVLSNLKQTRHAVTSVVKVWNGAATNLVPSLVIKGVSVLQIAQTLWALWAIAILSAMVAAWPRTFTRPTAVEGGIALGNDERGKPYRLSEGSLGYHVEIVAPSGSGKTNLLQNILLQRIEQGHGVVFIDLKAELSLVSWVKSVCGSCGRADDFRLISLADEALSVPYNPVKYGTSQEIHSQIMNSLTWSEDFYRKVASMALQSVISSLCDYRDQTKQLFHLGHVLDLLQDPYTLESFLSKLTQSNCLDSAKKIEKLISQLERSSERDKLLGLVAGLSALVNSSAGKLITTLAEKGSYDLNDAIDNGRVTYFSINSLKLRESASVFGKLLLQDLMRFVGERYAHESPSPRKSATVIIDEFASFAMPEFIELMDRARGAGIGIVLSHQSRADLRAISPEFQERVEANSNTTIVSGVKSPDDAEHYAGMIGTKTVTKETIQRKNVLPGWSIDTGMRSSREAEEFVLHPNRVKAIKRGEILVIGRGEKHQWGLVTVPLAKTMDLKRPSASDLAPFVTRPPLLTELNAQYIDWERDDREPVETDSKEAGWSQILA